MGDFENSLDLLNKLLCFDPENRISAEEGLEHPYFEEHRDDDFFEPEFEGEYDNSFEKNKDITEFDLQMLILKEINDINKKHKQPTYNIKKIQKSLINNENPLRIPHFGPTKNLKKN